MKKNRFSRLLASTILIVFVSLSLSDCGKTRVVFVDETIDVLGFVQNDQIISSKPIKEGVIVTPGFVAEFKRMKKELEEKNE